MEILETIGWIALGFVPTLVFLQRTEFVGGKRLGSKIAIHKKGGRILISNDKD